jgi:hypothetical protein
MRQRIPRRAWRGGGPSGHRTRVLIEDDGPALAISDFSLFERAGLDVAFCPGPGEDLAGCPVLSGGGCPVLDGADVVLHGLDPGLGVAAAIRRGRPGIPVLVRQRRRPDGSREPVPEGCMPLPWPCSVRGQVDAVTEAVMTAGGRDERPHVAEARLVTGPATEQGRRPRSGAARARPAPA